MRIGLARVSTCDQHPEAQQDALRAAGCEQVFTHTASGVLAHRPGLDQALLVARRGDQLVVTRLDRLGRSLANLIELSALLQERGIDLVVLDQGVDTSTAAGRMFFSVLGAISEFEHALLSKRTMAGLDAARREGRVGGRPTVMTPDRIETARMLREQGKSYDAIADTLRVGRSSVRRALADLSQV